MNRKVLLYGILTRLVVFGVIYLTFYSYYPGRPPAPLGYETGQGELNWHPLNPLLLYDGGQYIKIAQSGYTTELAVWFPFYPLLIRLAGAVTGSYGLAAVIMSNAAFFAALELVYRLAKLDNGERISLAAALSLMLMPAGAFFNVAYSESLFLFLVLGSFYAARTKHWWWAGILGGLAALTRNLGFLVFPALLVEYYHAQRLFPEYRVYSRSGLIYGPGPADHRRLRRLGRLVSGGGGIWAAPLLFFAYPVYLAFKFGDPLAFVHGQSGHFRAFMLPGWGIAADIIHMVNKPLDPFNFIILLNVLAFILGAASLVYINRPSYRFYGLCYLLALSAMPLVRGNMPHSTGVFRFVLGMFPAYLFLGGVFGSRRTGYYAAFMGFVILCAIAALMARKIYLA